MTPSVESMKKGTCGCGRSPDGYCHGYHALSESDWQIKLQEMIREERDLKDERDDDI